MLYLIDPRGAVWSADATIGQARARARVDGRPIDDLKFARAAMLLTLDDYVDLALRHGVEAPAGSCWTTASWPRRWPRRT